MHTGRASGIWAFVLAIASANILFFIYSGFAITFKRLGNRVKNKYKAAESRIIILVGSENGSTFKFAQSIHQQLIKQGEKSFITELNNYTVFTEAKLLIVMTATYGLGEAPTNGAKFTKLLEQHPQLKPIQYSVIGFGSHAYPDFCKFSFEVNQALSLQKWAAPLIDIHTVNDKSPIDFRFWVEAWSQQSGIQLTALPEISVKTNRLETLSVTGKISAEYTNENFLIRLKPIGKLKVTSGDLLAIYPEKDHRERLYSIGVIDQQIQLSVRLHPNGLGSGFLHRLTSGENIKARIIRNKHFYFPKKTNEIVMVSNGTGIAPFLGMISQNTQNVACHLYCGFRENSSFNMYDSFLEEHKTSGKLEQLHVAFSREGGKKYVSDLIARDLDFLTQLLTSGGVIMICGSLSMQKDVIALLENVCETKTGKSVSFYQSHGQILMDCY